MSLLIYAGIANSKSRNFYANSILQVDFESLDNSNLFVDESGIGRVPDIQTITQSDTQVKYGSFAGNCLNNSLQYNTSLNFVTDFSVEMDLYPTNFGSDTGDTNRCPFSCASSSSFTVINPAWLLESDGTLLIWTGSASITSNTQLTINQWNHVAWYRLGSTFYLAINGIVQTQTYTSTAAISQSGQFRFSGSTDSSTGRYSGFYDNIRILRNISAYSASNFTPPAGPHPTS